jgi:hypothetical protein
MGMGAHDVSRRVLAGLTVLILSAGCAGNASFTPTPTSPPAPAATATPAPTAGPTSSTTVPPSETATSSSGSATASPTSDQPQTIHLIEHPANLSNVRVGTLTGCTSTSGCQGDAIVGDDPMFDAATGTEVGRIMFECFLVDPGSGLYHCPGITIELDGRGQVVFTEKFDGSRQTSPITGGTGEFLGATGTVTAFLPSSGNGDFVITITK